MLPFLSILLKQPELLIYLTLEVTDKLTPTIVFSASEVFFINILAKISDRCDPMYRRLQELERTPASPL
jgi:hypothetical protein